MSARQPNRATETLPANMRAVHLLSAFPALRLLFVCRARNQRMTSFGVTVCSLREQPVFVRLGDCDYIVTAGGTRHFVQHAPFLIALSVAPFCPFRQYRTVLVSTSDTLCVEPSTLIVSYRVEPSLFGEPRKMLAGPPVDYQRLLDWVEDAQRSIKRLLERVAGLGSFPLQLVVDYSGDSSRTISPPPPPEIVPYSAVAQFYASLCQRHWEKEAKPAEPKRVIERARRGKPYLPEPVAPPAMAHLVFWKVR